MNDCPFCAIMRDHAPIKVAIIEPLNPVVPGHRIAIPAEHVTDAGDDPAVTARVMRVASQYAARLGQDYNLITSSGEHATQTIRHLHIHIVPRCAGDGLLLPWSNQEKAA